MDKQSLLSLVNDSFFQHIYMEHAFIAQHMVIIRGTLRLNVIAFSVYRVFYYIKTWTSNAQC